MDNGPKIIGRIDIDALTERVHLAMRKHHRHHPWICDECGHHHYAELDNRQHVVKTLDGKVMNVYLCECCIDDLFGDHEPKSIFE